MKELIHRHGGVSGQDAAQRGDRGRPDSGDRMKALEQLLPTLRADSGDLFERAALDPFAPQLAVVSDRKAVGLLLDRADQRKDALLGGNADLLALRRDERAGAVAVVLDHAVNGNVNVHGAQLLQNRLGVVHAAVDQQQVGRCLKALVSGQKMREAASQDLAHGGVVVLVVQPLQLEVPVGGAQGLAVRKDHHGGHDVRAGNVGNIVGLHAAGLGFHFEHLPQQLHRSAQLFLAGGNALRLLQRVAHLFVSMAGLKPTVPKQLREQGIEIFSCVDNDDAGRKFESENNFKRSDGVKALLDNNGFKDWNELLTFKSEHPESKLNENLKSNKDENYNTNVSGSYLGGR